MSEADEKVHIGFAVDKYTDKELRVYCAQNDIKCSKLLRKLIKHELEKKTLATRDQLLDGVINQLTELRERGVANGA